MECLKRTSPFEYGIFLHPQSTAVKCCRRICGNQQLLVVLLLLSQPLCELASLPPNLDLLKWKR